MATSLAAAGKRKAASPPRESEDTEAGDAEVEALTEAEAEAAETLGNVNNVEGAAGRKQGAEKPRGAAGGEVRRWEDALAHRRQQVANASRRYRQRQKEMRLRKEKALELLEAREQKLRDQGKDPRAPKGKKKAAKKKTAKKKAAKKKTKKKAAKKTTKKKSAKKKGSTVLVEASADD